eukprot:3774769-Prymnesium_polylepis.1
MAAASDSMDFDEQGCRYMAVTIGHRVEAVDKRHVKYTVFVRPDYDCLDRVIFAIDGFAGPSLLTVESPGPYEFTRQTQIVYSSLPVKVSVYFHPSLKQAPAHKEHE